jgi:hypothetical protein
VFDLETGSQRYLNSHTDTITCLKVYIEPSDSIHKTAEEEEASSGVDNAPKTLIVSGEAGKVPKVIVWSPGSRFEEPRVVSTLKGFHKDGISQVLEREREMWNSRRVCLFERKVLYKHLLHFTIFFFCIVIVFVICFGSSCFFLFFNFFKCFII